MDTFIATTIGNKDDSLSVSTNTISDSFNVCGTESLISSTISDSSNIGGTISYSSDIGVTISHLSVGNSRYYCPICDTYHNEDVHSCYIRKEIKNLLDNESSSIKNLLDNESSSIKNLLDNESSKNKKYLDDEIKKINDKIDLMLVYMKDILVEVKKISDKKDEVLTEIKKTNKSCEKMGSHIDFVENVYDKVKKPMTYVMNSVSRLSGGSKQEELPKVTRDKSLDLPSIKNETFSC